ncbi:hypothetical protein Tco_0530745 [Tanacetum coccineum]
MGLIFKGTDWIEMDEKIFLKFGLRYGLDRIKSEYLGSSEAGDCAESDSKKRNLEGDMENPGMRRMKTSSGKYDAFMDVWTQASVAKTERDLAKDEKYRTDNTSEVKDSVTEEFSIDECMLVLEATPNTERDLAKAEKYRTNNTSEVKDSVTEEFSIDECMLVLEAIPNKWLLVQIFHDNISQIDRRKLDQFTQFRFSSLTKEEGWNRIEEYVQYQDDLWDESSPSMNFSSISEAMQPTFMGRLKRAYKQISFLETPTREVGLKNPYLICDYCEGSHEADECELNNPSEQVCLSRGDVYNGPSLLRFNQHDDTSPWGNNKRKEKGEDGPEWTVRSKFKVELANFMLEKKFHTKGLGDMLVQHRKGLREQYSQILSAIDKSKTLESEASTFAITTRSGISTRDPPFPASPRPATDSFTEGETENEEPDSVEPSTT